MPTYKTWCSYVEFNERSFDGPSVSLKNKQHNVCVPDIHDFLSHKLKMLLGLDVIIWEIIKQIYGGLV